MPLTVAIMQPYFVPYAGYFRLFAAADVVVMFDCVQFPRRGWVHRNRLPLASGELDWLTLPVAKAPYGARIADLAFAPDARSRLSAEMRRFPLLERAPIPDEALIAQMLEVGSDVTSYLCELLGAVCDRLALKRPSIRSSTLSISPELRAQDRVLAIAQLLGATRYVNPPGGRALYDAAAFGSAGIELCFLEPYSGDPSSIVARLLAEPAGKVAAEIVAETRFHADAS